MKPESESLSLLSQDLAELILADSIAQRLSLADVLLGLHNNPQAGDIIATALAGYRAASLDMADDDFWDILENNTAVIQDIDPAQVAVALQAQLEYYLQLEPADQEAFFQRLNTLYHPLPAQGSAELPPKTLEEAFASKEVTVYLSRRYWSLLELKQKKFTAGNIAAAEIRILGYALALEKKNTQDGACIIVARWRDENGLPGFTSYYDATTNAVNFLGAEYAGRRQGLASGSV